MNTGYTAPRVQTLEGSIAVHTVLFLSSESHHEVKILRSNILKKFKSRLNLEGKRIMNDDLILLKLKDY